jgi:L-ascorbate metabolism protein UlaG (beta-lactamase superfamily)
VTELAARDLDEPVVEDEPAQHRATGDDGVTDERPEELDSAAHASESIAAGDDAAAAGARLTWLGHATVLIELDGVRVLTDPVLRRRLAHLERTEAVAAGAVPPLDLVLVSHVHYDHLDLPSLRRLVPPPARVALPVGAARLLRRTPVGAVVELAEGSELEVGVIRVRATHAEHRTARRPLGPALPSLGFVVTGSRSLYFAGDTDLVDGMRSLADGLDVALLPVAGWGPRLPPGHLDPARAAEAVRRLRPRLAVPIHWGTLKPVYRRTPYSGGAPEEFAARVDEVAPEVEVRILRVGESCPF